MKLRNAFVVAGLSSIVAGCELNTQASRVHDWAKKPDTLTERTAVIDLLPSYMTPVSPEGQAFLSAMNGDRRNIRTFQRLGLHTPVLPYDDTLPRGIIVYVGIPPRQ